MKEYLSLSHLAEYYDIHPDTLRKRIKELDIKQDDHFVIIGKSVRFDVNKIHPLLTSPICNQTVEDVLNLLRI
jgi:hypothetical protein